MWLKNRIKYKTNTNEKNELGKNILTWSTKELYGDQKKKWQQEKEQPIFYFLFNEKSNSIDATSVRVATTYTPSDTECTLYSGCAWNIFTFCGQRNSEC